MMKILVIMGTYRKGNCFTITKKVEEYIRQIADESVEFNYLNLINSNLEYCRGCFKCFPEGEDICPIQDDHKQIEQQMFDADSIIFVSPVYANAITALMKTFIERFEYLSNRPRFHKKAAMIISTAAASNPDLVLKHLNLTALSWGFNKVIKLGIMTHPLSLEINQRPHIVKKIEKAAAEYYTTVKHSHKLKPSLVNLVVFKLMKKGVYVTKDSHKYFVKNHEYFKPYENKRYFFEARINIFAELISSLVAGIFISRIKKSIK